MRLHLQLSPPQLRCFRSPARFKVVVAGRRFGKTHLVLGGLLAVAGAGPDRVCWYIAPSYRMAKRIAWKVLKRMVPREALAGKPNESELTITLWNGSVVALLGADNPDSLRGPGLDAVALDEYALMDAATWPEVVRPMLSVSRGPAWFIGTPAGYNHFHELYVKGLQGADREGGVVSTWESFEFTSVEGGWISPEEIAAARADLDDRTFRQEYEASFETMAGRVYDAFDRKHNVDASIRWPMTGGAILVPVKAGIDFNINPGMHACVAYRDGARLNIVDELFVPGGNTEEMAIAIRERVAGAPEYHAMPDPTGNARKTSADVGVTDLTILRSRPHSFRVYAPPGPYPTAEKIKTTNAAFKNAAGQRRVFVHPRCRLVIKSLEGLVFKKSGNTDTSIPDKSGGLDHMADAVAYLTCWEFPLVARVSFNQELVL